MRAIFEINNIKYNLEFMDSETGRKVYEQLPFAGNVQRWGDEIFFDVPFGGIMQEDDARDIMEIGEVGYWINGSAISIFFGPTPASQNNEPRSMEPINVFARITDDPLKLKDTKNDDFIYMTAT